MNIDEWKKAGHIAHEALVYGASLIKADVKLSDVSDAVEKKIYELGGELAFPVNISLNEVAAHDTPFPIEERRFGKDDIVKLDVGVHINGAIGDTAMTIDISGKNSKLVSASKEALNEAIKMIKPGVKTKEIGKVVEATIQKYGFQPIRNLSGHQIKEYHLHAGLTIPNYDDGSNNVLKEGMIIAVEPFATSGEGFIQEGPNAEIFSLMQKRPLRSLFAREALKLLESRNNLPTSSRWLAQKMGALKSSFALKEMNQNDMLHLYPALIEVKKGLVSQAEHTLLVTKDGCEILTS